MRNIKIVEMNESHISQVMEFDKLCFTKPWTRNMFIEELNSQHSYYICAICDNKVIGYVGIWIIIEEAQIMNIAVDPDFWNNGVGSILLENIVLYCQNKGVYEISLEVRESNIGAQNLYKKFGFKSESVRKSYYADNHEDAIIMLRRGK